MKFILTHDLKKNNPLKTTISLYLFFLSMALLGDIYLKTMFLGLDAQSILTTIIGDENEYIDPLERVELWQMVHIESFMAMMFFMMIFALLVRINKKSYFYIMGVSSFLIIASYILLLLIDSLFIAKLWMVFHYSWHTLLLIMILLILKTLWTK